MNAQYGARRRILKLALVGALVSGVAQAETRIIAMLGDSLTQGFGLQVQDGLVPQLEAWLQRAGADVRVINAGVSGDTTAGGAARVDWTLSDEVDGLIVALGANDALRGIAPAVAKANLETILQAAASRDVAALLVGAPVPGNYGTGYVEEFEAVYTDLAATFAVPLVANMLAPIQAANGDVADYLQADFLHPNPAGVLLIVEALGPEVLEFLQNTGG